MKIAVISANGKQGRKIVEEATRRNLDVTAVVRGENKSLAKKFIQRDLFDLTSDDLKDFDVVIDAFGTWADDTLHQHSTSLMHLSDILSGTDTRLLVVGGAGSLYIDKDHKLTLSDSPDFIEAFKPLAKAMGDSLEKLRSRDDVNWTYISPAADFQFEGERTGEYILAGEDFTVNSNGESFISYADYSIAMIDEAVNGEHIKQRISVLSKQNFIKI
ncbi:SDR family oxidoreductase [Peptostreptococcus faecalis]|uniref:SDR family oxidoreductase n=1 Tax=Peptostreptococcus faecalis TaxID=2045015 RepID=UPI000C7B460B|nr:NAD(P)-dependent oxidoreductase [Peptostreptococcus faecalis]